MEVWKSLSQSARFNVSDFGLGQKVPSQRGIEVVIRDS